MLHKELVIVSNGLLEIEFRGPYSMKSRAGGTDFNFGEFGPSEFIGELSFENTSSMH